MSTKTMDTTRFQLTLYIAGESSTSEVAVANLKKIEEAFGEEVSVQVLDIEADPEIAERDGINISPTLVRNQPLPVRKLIGDLSNHEKVIKFLKKE
ncbi:MAG: circadian clock protein KaiB [Candidatus Omnitrophica bacterium]|nr:circadian clock protein KaiB [Candidatus Omnitrophota bacterium]MCA9418228.1 circadian clock protein KaiB [Candidatus Omnitrophota bacterium]MCA9439295.1 circadian clock protein KaiB [Candidatus Omnitrophota bacterium]